MKKILIPFIALVLVGCSESESNSNLETKPVTELVTEIITTTVSSEEIIVSTEPEIIELDETDTAINTLINKGKWHFADTPSMDDVVARFGLTGEPEYTEIPKDDGTILAKLYTFKSQEKYNNKDVILSYANENLSDTQLELV